MRSGSRMGAARASRVALAAAAALFAACAPDAPQDFLQPAGPVAQRQDELWTLVFWIAVGVFVLVEGLLVYALFRFRRRRDDEIPRQVHGHTRLEIAWTIAPAVLLALIAVPTVATIFELSRGPAEADNPLRVTVTAYQWWWEYEYENEGVVAANELHIPVGRPVVLTLHSNDILHSFWVPKLGGKQDVVPGAVLEGGLEHENVLWLAADEPGTYLGQCAEFCGISHANMRLRVIAQEPEEFDQWVEEQLGDAAEPDTAAAQEGLRVFEENLCSACHTVRGTRAQGVVAPDLTHLASRATFAGAMFDLDEENLRLWLQSPSSVKPGALMPDASGMSPPLTEDDIDNLIAYLLTLRP